MSTNCRRYLSCFVGMSADTIDILVQNGIDSVHTLRAINMDKDWHHLPTQISIGQKLLLRQALAKLEDITDDDNNGDKQEITARQSISNSQSIEIITLDDEELVLDNNVEVNNNSGNRRKCHQRIVSTDRPFLCNYDNCNKMFKTKALLRQHLNCVHTTGRRIVCNYNNCNKTFKNKHYMRLHEKRMHENQHSNTTVPLITVSSAAATAPQQHQPIVVPKVETKPDIKPIYLLSWTPKKSTQ
ncbi:uncharacterized protein LOC128952755 [Oppia nitens]|uniref:uncharacterized protein LOC128952755 n=1 Tax=Oppia nitens TaxID=1686743 RepID=UPI0023DBA234|nr:uncharacterized protein LOC128952755 [Oppia nitens]